MFRGRGGRRGSYSNGYQRGRGRGVPASSSKKWVRPSTREPQKNVSESTKNGVDKNSSTNVANRTTNVLPETSASKLTGVILKGPAKRYPHRPAGSKSNTWKRPRDESKRESISKSFHRDKRADVAASVEERVPSNSESKESTKPSPSLKPSIEPTTNLLRRGKHKLVSQNQVENRLDSEASPAQGIEKSGAPSIPDEEGDKGTKSATELPMKKKGRNKLVLTKSDGEPFRSPEPREDADRDDEKVLARKGKNKLVLKGASAVADAKGKWDPRSMGSAHSGRGRGRGKKAASGRGAKRIKLNPSEADASVGLDGGDNDSGPDGEGEQPAKAAATEKYTEFAYRQSSSSISKRGRGGRGRGTRGRGGSMVQSRNMGLVRVEPDAATTRMCPIYLRGEPCTNPKCTKRHDVPKEAAIPICSFFQRNGLCLKGDECPFRHIKVNPHATICPSFSLLGFCENKDCIMKHVRAPKKSK